MKLTTATKLIAVSIVFLGFIFGLFSQNPQAVWLIFRYPSLFTSTALHAHDAKTTVSLVPVGEEQALLHKSIIEHRQDLNRFIEYVNMSRNYLLSHQSETKLREKCVFGMKCSEYFAVLDTVESDFVGSFRLYSHLWLSGSDSDSIGSQLLDQTYDACDAGRDYSSSNPTKNSGIDVLNETFKNSSFVFNSGDVFASKIDSMLEKMNLQRYMNVEMTTNIKAALNGTTVYGFTSTHELHESKDSLLTQEELAFFEVQLPKKTTNTSANNTSKNPDSYILLRDMDSSTRYKIQQDMIKAMLDGYPALSAFLDAYNQNKYNNNYAGNPDFAVKACYLNLSSYLNEATNSKDTTSLYKAFAVYPLYRGMSDNRINRQEFTTTIGHLHNVTELQNALIQNPTDVLRFLALSEEQQYVYAYEAGTYSEAISFATTHHTLRAMLDILFGDAIKTTVVNQGMTLGFIPTYTATATRTATQTPSNTPTATIASTATRIPTATVDTKLEFKICLNNIRAWAVLIDPASTAMLKMEKYYKRPDYAVVLAELENAVAILSTHTPPTCSPAIIDEQANIVAKLAEYRSLVEKSIQEQRRFNDESDAIMESLQGHFATINNLISTIEIRAGN